MTRDSNKISDLLAGQLFDGKKNPEGLKAKAQNGVAWRRLTVRLDFWETAELKYAGTSDHWIRHSRVMSHMRSGREYPTIPLFLPKKGRCRVR